MIVTFFVRSMPYPVGGNAALYEFANGLCRRGHDVCVVHGRWEGQAAISDLDDLAWFEFDERVRHQIALDPTRAQIPDADVVVGYAKGGPAAGLPVGVIQGFEAFPAELEDRIFRAPRPKICVARWLVELGRGRGVPEHQLWHVPLAVHHERYRIIEPLESRPLQVAMFYSPHHQKGATVGLDAIAETRRRVPGVHVRLFGTTDPVHTLPSDVEYFRLPDLETLVGEIYNTSRIFVCPSRTEGFGLSSLEAMACGCALVTTANGGSGDFAFHRDTALVSPPDDAGQLADNLEKLLLDDDLRLDLARRGAEHALGFQWDDRARLLEEHFESYLADPDSFQG